MSSERNEYELMRYAVEMNHVLDIRQLISNGFDIESREHVFEPDTDPMTLLCYAASCHAMDTVLTLVALGVNINSPSLHGLTPIHVAISYMKTPYTNTHQTRSIDVTEAMVRLLIYYGSDICASDCQGETPLHLAVRLGVPSVVKILLNHGAQVSPICKKGFSTLDICKREINKLMRSDTSVKHFGVLWGGGSCSEEIRRYNTIENMLQSVISQELKFYDACTAELMQIRKERNTDNDNIEDVRHIFQKLHSKFISPNLKEVTPREIFDHLIHQGYLNAAPDVPRVFAAQLSTPL